MADAVQNKDAAPTGADGAKAQGAQPADQKNDSSSVETQAAANSGDSGLQEADIRTLRHDAGLDQLAGHEANVLAWEQTDAGKAFKADEAKRQTALKDEAKTVDAQTNKDGLDEGAAKYVEVISK